MLITINNVLPYNLWLRNVITKPIIEWIIYMVFSVQFYISCTLKLNWKYGVSYKIYKWNYNYPNSIINDLNVCMMTGRQISSLHISATKHEAETIGAPLTQRLRPYKMSHVHINVKETSGERSQSSLLAIVEALYNVLNCAHNTFTISSIARTICTKHRTHRRASSR